MLELIPADTGERQEHTVEDQQSVTAFPVEGEKLPFRISFKRIIAINQNLIWIPILVSNDHKIKLTIIFATFWFASKFLKVFKDIEGTLKSSKRTIREEVNIQENVLSFH